MIKLIKCSKCGVTKHRSKFNKGGNKNGLKSHCKICIKNYYAIEENKQKNIDSCNRYYSRTKTKVQDNKETNIQKYLFFSAKARAKQRGEKFSLKMSDIIVPTHCPILGIKMRYNRVVKQDNSFSLDRINSNRGYTKSNIQVISLRANRIKNDATIEELLLIANYLKKLKRNKIKNNKYKHYVRINKNSRT